MLQSPNLPNKEAKPLCSVGLDRRRGQLTSFTGKLSQKGFDHQVPFPDLQFLVLVPKGQPACPMFLFFGEIPPIPHPFPSSPLPPGTSPFLSVQCPAWPLGKGCGPLQGVASNCSHEKKKPVYVDKY